LLLVDENKEVTCGTKRDEMGGVWKKLQNKELNSTYYSTNIGINRLRRMSWLDM
jgi:hypothetical protein